MTRPAQPDPHVEDAIHEMEETVAAVASWAKAFHALGTAPLPIDAEAVFVMAVAFERTAEKLGEQWKEAFSLVRCDREGGR